MSKIKAEIIKYSKMLNSRKLSALRSGNISVKSKNGFLISTSITTSKVKVKWECEFGHKWNATWEKVKRGTWCPECAKSKKHYKTIHLYFI